MMWTIINQGLQLLFVIIFNFQKAVNAEEKRRQDLAKVQKYEQGKIGLNFFDIWY